MWRNSNKLWAEYPAILLKQFYISIIRTRLFVELSKFQNERWRQTYTGISGIIEDTEGRSSFVKIPSRGWIICIVFTINLADQSGCDLKGHSNFIWRVFSNYMKILINTNQVSFLLKYLKWVLSDPRQSWQDWILSQLDNLSQTVCTKSQTRYTRTSGSEAQFLRVSDTIIHLKCWYDCLK